jgi:hypothetical protein
VRAWAKLDNSGIYLKGRVKPQGQRPVRGENLCEPYRRHLGYFLGRPPERGTCADLSLNGTFAHRCLANCEAWMFLLFFFIRELHFSSAGSDATGLNALSCSFRHAVGSDAISLDGFRMEAIRRKANTVRFTQRWGDRIRKSEVDLARSHGKTTHAIL